MGEKMFFPVHFSLPECPAGFYGADCLHRCLCQNGAFCNKTNGNCVCASGWRGAACELGKMMEDPQKNFLVHLNS